MRRSYTPDFKAACLARIDEEVARGNDDCVRQIAREKGIPPSTLRGWYKHAEKVRNMLVSTKYDDIIAELRAQKVELLRTEVHQNEQVVLAMMDKAMARLYLHLEMATVADTIKILHALTTIHRVNVGQIVKLEDSAAGNRDAEDNKRDSDSFFDKAYDRPTAQA